MKTFGQLYAEQHGLRAEHVERDLFLRCLYPHARLLHQFVTAVAPRYFTADVDLVRETALLVRPGEYRFEIQAHRRHPAARGVLRRHFYLRLSTRRLRHWVKATFHERVPAQGSAREIGRIGPFQPVGA